MPEVEGHLSAATVTRCKAIGGGHVIGVWTGLQLGLQFTVVPTRSRKAVEGR